MCTIINVLQSMCTIINVLQSVCTMNFKEEYESYRTITILYIINRQYKMM